MIVDLDAEKTMVVKPFLQRFALLLTFLSLTGLPLTTLAWTVSDNVVEIEEKTDISTAQSTAASMTNKTNLEEKEKEKDSAKEESVIFKKIKTQLSENDSDKPGRPVFQKTTSSLNEEEQAAYDYSHAVKQFDLGETFQAERVLINALNSKPDHHVSRKELATLYLKREQLIEAEHILQEGLRLDENNADFLKLMAVIHDKRSEPDKALGLLVKVKDSKQDKNYFAFLGHIYQQTGQYGLARQQYFRLLQLEPRNPTWLLGVSIALDAEGKKSAALEGYQQLINEGRMDPKVLEYVQDRIRVLK